MLRRILGSESNDVTGECRGQHNEELNDLYSSPNVVRVFKSIRSKWVGHVERMGKKRGVYKVLMRKHQRKRPTGNSRVDGRIILKWIF